MSTLRLVLSFLLIGGNHAPLYPVLLGSLWKGRRGMFDFATVWYTSISLMPAVFINSIESCDTYYYWEIDNTTNTSFCVVHQVLCGNLSDAGVSSLYLWSLTVSVFCMNIRKSLNISCCIRIWGRNHWDNHVCPWLTFARLHNKKCGHTLNKVQ